MSRARLDEHLLPHLGLADVERRRGQVHDQLRPGERELGRRRAGLPDVLADREADGRPTAARGRRAATGDEVALLVEHAVVRQELLAVDRRDRAVGAHDARVREGLVQPRRADEGDDSLGLARDLLDGLPRGLDERRPQEQVLGRVAGRGKLGDDDEIRLGGLRLGDGSEDRLPVAVEVSDDRIQLCERDSQGFRLTVTNLV